ASDTYDQRVSSQINALTSILEPIFIVVLGGFVGLVAMAILLPMLNISSVIK
ncbi:MAG: type II secretion system F family protein, partial [Myxococcota bacterium]|nr:type II secretion system F family protein [Myxococcota bacterium]